jgi:hypothetical protein
VRDPTTVTAPLDFSGLARARLPLISQRAQSWTATRFTLQGSNVTDAYEPGRTAFFPDMRAVSSRVCGSEIAMFAREAGPAWHAEVSTSSTGSVFASDNLPPPAKRGLLTQSEHYRWFTQDDVLAGGPVGKRADLLVAATGQWASETVPQGRPGEDVASRVLGGTARGRVQVSDRDQLDAQFSGSRIRLSNRGIPAGLEALVGRRMSPSFFNSAGFAGLGESDSFDFLQAGWTRRLTAGVLDLRYGYSRTQLNTIPSGGAGGQSRIDLGTGVTGGTPPLANRASRTRQELKAAFSAGSLRIGGGWERAGIRNRWSAPSNLNLITAGGAPALVVELNTPVDSRSNLQTWSAYAREAIRIAPWLSVDLALAGDFSAADRISWKSISPRAGLAFAVSRLVLRGSYARLYAPLGGRYLDYGNANSLGGTQSLWTDRNADGRWEPSESGTVVARFGGPYASIDRSLRRPYADEFNAGASLALPLGISASVQLFRRDDKRRIAAINVGVPGAAFSPVQILDPGGDGAPGTFDDRTLTVFAQDPSTLGQDQFLLTNPAGLRMLNEGMIAEVGGGSRSLEGRVSFMAMKSWGPTNPGNSAMENDPGVVGALFQDPNTAIHAAGRAYFDRAYAGKVQLVATLPGVLREIQLVNTATYFDGLPFGRRLLVSGLPQGPFLVAATVRGSPEGGHRTEYALNWNLRVRRSVRMPRGALGLAFDVYNVLNAGNKTQEMDISGALFNQRLPVAIQAPRFLRVTIDYQF